MPGKKPVDSMGIDWEMIEAMAQRFSPPEEIQAALGITPAQFKRAIRHHYKKSIKAWWDQHAAKGRYLIRQEQFEKAIKGNVTALKWLGIQHLGQRLHVEEELYKPDAGKGEAQEDKAKGFAILTPQGMDPGATQTGPKVPQPHDEVPVVEQLLKAEAEEEPTPNTDGTRRETVVSAFLKADEA